jgi:hypothetical protein
MGLYVGGKVGPVGYSWHPPRASDGGGGVILFILVVVGAPIWGMVWMFQHHPFWAWVILTSPLDVIVLLLPVVVFYDRRWRREAAEKQHARALEL